MEIVSMSNQKRVAVRGILLDIEGTTSSISFVHDVMFPFVLEHLDQFLREQWHRDDVQAACQQVAVDAGHASLDSWIADHNQKQANSSQADNQRLAVELVSSEVRRLMAADVKATGLKALQGLIWEVGFQSGELQSHVYPDVLPAIRAWREADIDVRIYSSGSIAAQKLFFGHVDGAGDCLSLFTGHYDTTIGSKKESDSYQRIASEWGLRPADILFISDIAAELVAASAAGLQTRASIRQGNTPLPADFAIEQISSFAKVHPN
jgi:enolase-phosphatase E1